MKRELIIILIYIFTIVIGSINIAFTDLIFVKYDSILSYNETFLAALVFSTILSFPVFIIYYFLFQSKKCSHISFLKTSFYFIIGSLFFISFVMFLIDRANAISYMIIISYTISASISLFVFKFIKGEDVPN